MKKVLFLLLFLANLSAFAQLPNGSVAPDFTLTDYYGTSHNLYAYLNSGKTVFIEIFAAHCPTCWGYHQTNRLKNMYDQYGPDGSDEIMVLALEHDQWNDSNAFIGNGPAWVTQGNWLTGTPYPIFDVEDPDRGVFADYNVNFYPIVYKICPDKIIERVMTSETEAQLYQKVQDCQPTLSIEELVDIGSIHIDQPSRSLIIDQYQNVSSVEVVDLQGRSVKTIAAISHSTISMSELNTGVYLFKIQTEEGPVVKRLFLN